MNFLRILSYVLIGVLLAALVQWVLPARQTVKNDYREYHLLSTKFSLHNCYSIGIEREVGRPSLPPSYCYDGQCCFPFCLWMCNPGISCLPRYNCSLVIA